MTILLSLAMQEAISSAAAHFDVPPSLISAIVRVESSGLTGCIRFEPRYRYVWDNAKEAPFRSLLAHEVGVPRAPEGFKAPKGLHSTADTEWTAQRVSWGPMQLMGASAREMGFDGWLPDLCSVNGIWWGTKYLAQLKRRYLETHGWKGVTAAYNAGSPRLKPDGTYKNQDYINKLVLAGALFEE